MEKARTHDGGWGERPNGNRLVFLKTPAPCHGIWLVGSADVRQEDQTQMDRETETRVGGSRKHGVFWAWLGDSGLGWG
jgi:hypothetical protein